MPKILLMLVFMTSVGANAAIEDLDKDPSRDPRLAKPDLAKCVETAKEMLRSSEYDEKDEEFALISACRDVEPKCVKVAGDNLVSSERGFADKFLPVIKSCRGRGMGECYEKAISRLTSFEYRDASQAQSILKKCE